MSSHGVYKSEATLVTSRMVGLFREGSKTRHEFLSAINSTLRPETFPSVVHPIGQTTERTDHAGASAYPDLGFGCQRHWARSPGRAEDGGAFRIIMQRYNRRLYRCARFIVATTAKPTTSFRNPMSTLLAIWPVAAASPGWARGPHASHLARRLSAFAVGDRQSNWQLSILRTPAKPKSSRFRS